MVRKIFNRFKQYQFNLKGVSVYLVVGLTVVLWASAFAGIRAGLQSYSPAGVALLRYLTASVALAFYALITRMPLPEKREIPGFLAIGLVGFTVYNVALNAGEKDIEAGTASLIVASAPIFVALMASAIFHEKLKARGWAGIFLAFVGVAIISIPTGVNLRVSASMPLILAAAVSQAVYTIAQKSYLKRYTPLQVVTYAVWAGTLFLLPFTPRLILEFGNASMDSTLAVAYMGIFPGAIGYTCWSVALSRLSAARAGSFLYLVPAVAILISWVWLGEIPTPGSLLGGLLIILGVIVVNTRQVQANQVSQPKHSVELP